MTKKKQKPLKPAENNRNPIENKCNPIKKQTNHEKPTYIKQEQQKPTKFIENQTKKTTETKQKPIEDYDESESQPTVIRVIINPLLLSIKDYQHKKYMVIHAHREANE